MNPPSSDKSSSDYSKQREYLKQQHQLRNMTKSSPALSADDMIESLLSRKEIFQKKKDTNYIQKKSSKMEPPWLAEGNEPAAYSKVWEQVRTPSGLTDTPALSCILLGSGLGTDTLGYIWSLTNTTVSGALTRMEVYKTLALVALAQKGYSFTNLLVLNQFHEAPVPRLDLRPSVPFAPATTNVIYPTGSSATSIQSPLSQVPTVTETLFLLDTLSEPLEPAQAASSASTVTMTSLSILSATDLNKLTTPADSSICTNNAEDDDFDDFKSADIFSSKSLTVLDVRDNVNCLMGNKSNENLFKANVTSFPFSPEKKNLSDDTTSASELNQSAIDDTSPSDKKENNVFVTSSLQEVLREDLTLAPVSLSSMPPSISVGAVESDRYNALRQLAATNYEYSDNIEKEEMYDDFGDFIAANEPSSLTVPSTKDTVQSPVLQSDLQEKCLEACVHVLREANDLFKSIDDSKVLAEVVGDDRGKRYLEEIVEIQRIGQRITSKTIQRDDCELSKQLESLCKALEPFTKPLEHTHMEEEKGGKCGLCQCEIGPAHVKYGINQFHAPCANLFLHVTGELLPLTPVT